MKHLTKLYEQLCRQQQAHNHMIYNYTIPETWNLYGFPHYTTTKQKEIIVNPYAFTKFTLEHILQEKKQPLKRRGWCRESVIYHLLPRLTTAWDHDRTHALERDNLYHLNDHGTFLKAILLLKLYQRMGFNTILMQAPFALGKHPSHPFAGPYAISAFENFDEILHDPLLGDYSLKEEYQAFEEAAHHLGFHIIWQIDFATMARDNAYIKEHPEWFYWIKKDTYTHIHAPEIPYLTENCLPEKDILPFIEKSEDVLRQKEYFKQAPHAGKTLSEIEQQDCLTTVPFLHDRINSTLPKEDSYTPLRFFTDTIDTHPAILRADLYPQKKKNESLWDFITQTITDLQDAYHIDGFYFSRVYLYPKQLLARMIKTVKDKGKAVITEEMNPDISAIDAISANSAYLEYDVWNHQLHTFAYRLKDQTIPVFAAAEFLDTPRIVQHGNAHLQTMLHVFNQFLPNTIPYYVSGMECGEQQPVTLSDFQDKQYQNALSQQDDRYLKQPMLDDFSFDYRQDAMYTLPHLLESIKKIRNAYLSAILDASRCIPLCFDSPLDQGIGFAYLEDSKILLVIANTNIEHTTTLCTHLENVLPHAKSSQLRQIFSTRDPFVYDIAYDEYLHLPLSFEPGEIKFIEIS